MKIDLSQFVGKKVDVVLRSGKILYSVTVSFYNSSLFPYEIDGETYKKDGHWEHTIYLGSVLPAEEDIVKIKLSTMKKYEQIENQIAGLQKEVERLKNEEKKEKLPECFNRKYTIAVLNGNLSSLGHAFRWSSTPQGLMHWERIQSGLEVLTNEDIIQLQKWVILSYQQEENK